MRTIGLIVTNKDKAESKSDKKVENIKVNKDKAESKEIEVSGDAEIQE